MPNSLQSHGLVPQAPLSMGFFRQEYWSGLPFPTPGDLFDPGMEPASPASPALVGGFFTTEPPGKPLKTITHVVTFSTKISYLNLISVRVTLVKGVMWGLLTFFQMANI